jgi:hypothetical protein
MTPAQNLYVNLHLCFLLLFANLRILYMHTILSSTFPCSIIIIFIAAAHKKETENACSRGWARINAQHKEKWVKFATRSGERARAVCIKRPAMVHYVWMPFFSPLVVMCLSFVLCNRYNIQMIANWRCCCCCWRWADQATARLWPAPTEDWVSGTPFACKHRYHVELISWGYAFLTL